MFQGPGAGSGLVVRKGKVPELEMRRRKHLVRGGEGGAGMRRGGTEGGEGEWWDSRITERYRGQVWSLDSRRSFLMLT